MEEAKLKEAKKLLVEAEKSEKTSMFKWKPDWESASMYYDQSAKAFALAKDHKAAKAVFLKARNAHEQFGSLFHAGKAMEGAAAACVALGQTKESLAFIKQATSLFRQHGAVDEACNSMEKAAGQAEKAKQFEHAVALLLEVAELRREEDRPKRCKHPLLKALQCALKGKFYERAFEVVGVQSEIALELKNADQFAKSILSGVAVQLMADDYVSAERWYLESVQKNPRVSTSEESLLADRLLSAFDQGDDTALTAVTNDQMFGFIDNQLALEVRKLKSSSMPSAKAAPAPIDDTEKLVVKTPVKAEATPKPPAAEEPVAPAKEEPAPEAPPAEPNTEAPASENTPEPIPAVPEVAAPEAEPVPEPAPAAPVEEDEDSDDDLL